jgi:hypothetical protein
MLNEFRRLTEAFTVALLLASPLIAQTFAPPKNYAPFTDSFQLKAGDFNRDGAADFVGAANFNHGTQTEVVIYMNSGTGSFRPPTVLAGSVGAAAVAVGDFNQDGKLDIAFTSFTKARVGVAYGNGNGTFANPLFYAINGAADSIAVGDYNDDGKLDIATLSNSTKGVTILRNIGSSFTKTSFAVPLYYSGGNSQFPPDTVIDLVSGDFNGNHKQDLGYVDICQDSSCGPGLARIYTLTNTGSGFTPNLLADQLSGNDEIDSADVDLDGKVDLLVAETGNGYETAYVDYSNGDGSFTSVDFNSDLLSVAAPQHMLVADFNNDGIEDIAGYTDQDLLGDPDYGFDVYTGKGGRSGFNAPVHFADDTNASPRGGFSAGFIDANATKDVALVDSTSFAIFANTTPTSGDPCTYPSGTGLHNCGPANGSSGPATIHVLDSYRAAVQPAQRIEFWVDGQKVFQEYADLLNTTVTLSAGTHQLSVVGVDATGQFIKSNTSYTVTQSPNDGPTRSHEN